jgi:LacI family transcriptional regulator
MATIRDVARRAGVSTYTVSVVLNQAAYVSPELTKRVQKAVRDLDYTINGVARSLQTRRTHMIGMLIPDIANPFYAKVVRGVEGVCKRNGYSLVLGNTYNDPHEQACYLATLRSKQVEGFLIFVAAGDETEVAALVKRKVPVAFLGRYPRSFDADAVTADNRKGTRLGVQYLVGKGHRRIAIITGHFSLTANRDRLAAWKQSLRQTKLPIPTGYACEGDWTADSGYRHALKLLDRRTPPTAILTANFLMMTGVLRALKERGLACPSQVEVMSSDDSEWLDVFQPPISTIVQPSYEMGVQGAELLFKRIRDTNRKPEKIVLEPTLKLRP